MVLPGTNFRWIPLCAKRGWCSEGGGAGAAADGVSCELNLFLELAGK